MEGMVTYKIESDLDGKLKEAARIACDFWNRFLIPNGNYVIRLGTFFKPTNTIAAAWEPYENNGVHYGKVKFNTRFLAGYNKHEIAGTIIHEIGHTLGIGWDKWDGLFDHETGVFHSEYIKKFPALKQMVVELEHGSGTAYSHWDEEAYDKELMTGFKDDDEYILPVTIDVMELLGHQVTQRLNSRQNMNSIFQDLEGVQFSRLDEARLINRDYYEITPLMEEIYAS